MNIKTTIKLVALSLCFSIPAFQSASAVAPEPTIQTISFTASPGNCSEINLNFFPGDGSRRLVVACANNPVSSFPVDGQGYTPSSLFGTGADLGNQNYVIYNASGTATTVSGLSGGTEYFFAIFEVNGNGNNSNFLLTGYLEAHDIAPGLTVTVSSSSGDMCAGDSVRILAHGGDTYQWSPSGSLSSSTDSVVWAKPTTTTPYTVIGSDNISGCTDSKTITITVYPRPNVTLGNFSNKCINGSTITLNSGSPAGGTYSGDGVTGNHFNPAAAGIGSHVITYYYSDIHGCFASDTSTINVLNAPVVTFSTLPDVCINSPAFALSGGSPTGGVYSGTSVTSGQFHPSVSGSGTFSIRYIYTNSGGCSDTAFSNQNVRGLPNVVFATLSPACLNTPPFPLTGGTPAGGSYVGTGVSNSQFSPLVSGAGTFLITYNYTDSTGCSGADTSVQTIHTLPNVNQSPFTAVCQNTGPVTLSGGSPSGGTYSGTGVGGGIFYTGIAGAGQHTITYSYTNNNNCTNTATQNITVHPVPHPDLGPDVTACGNTTVHLFGGLFSSYLWSVGGHNSFINLDTIGRGLGTFQVVLGVSDSFNCVNHDTILVTFDQCNGIYNIPDAGISFSVYPNPSSGEFNILSKEECDLSVFDIKGSLIIERKNIPVIYSFGENLSPGTYIVRLRKNQLSEYKLILKN